VTFLFSLIELAFWIISSVMSTPITFPVAPTLEEAKKQSNPAPHPYHH
jgi:hypothetical protein